MPDANYSRQREQILRRALRRLRNESPSSIELAQAAEALNTRIRHHSARYRFLWSIGNTEVTLNLVAGQRTYSVGTAPAGIPSDIEGLETFELYRGGSYLPLRFLGKAESLQTWEREGQGEPVLVYLERGSVFSGNKIHVFPTPNSSYTAKFTYRRALYDLDNATDVPDFPGEWTDFLIKDLACELAPEYGETLDRVQYHELKAQESLRSALASNSDNRNVTPLVTEYC